MRFYILFFVASDTMPVFGQCQTYKMCFSGLSMYHYRRDITILQVIVEKTLNSQVPDIDKRKFLVPNDISVAQFMWIIRKRIQLPSEKALFLFVDKVLPQSR